MWHILKLYIVGIGLVWITACTGQLTADPIFTSSDSATVAENQTTALTLTVIDASTITYDIAEKDSADFDLNASTGVITFKIAPDFEDKPTYVFTATATDALGNKATQAVTISILDIDEADPIFTSSSTVAVAENQTKALTLVATDANPIIYGISGGDSTAFNVDTRTGVIVFNIAPDFETKHSYDFNATATDTAGNQKIQGVIVSILDEDETVQASTSLDTTNTVENQSTAPAPILIDSSTAFDFDTGIDTTLKKIENNDIDTNNNSKYNDICSNLGNTVSVMTICLSYVLLFKPIACNEP
jgi:hypothetical protein